MFGTYSMFLVLIVTGCCLVPVSGLALLLNLPTERQRLGSIAQRWGHRVVRFVLFGLATLQGIHWLLRVHEVGYQTAMGWGVGAIAIMAAGLFLTPATIIAIAMRNRLGSAPTVAFGVVAFLSVVQSLYWLGFAPFAILDALATLTR